jgi:catechol 2,3-dioxygenase-like lactoylglutathione lyase family enzyme
MTSSPDRRPVGRLRWIEIDTPDPDPMVAFWSEVLGAEVDPQSNDVQPPFQYIALTAAEPGAPQVVFQRVPESKTIKNRRRCDRRRRSRRPGVAHREPGWAHPTELRGDDRRCRNCRLIVACRENRETAGTAPPPNRVRARYLRYTGSLERMTFT